MSTAAWFRAGLLAALGAGLAAAPPDRPGHRFACCDYTQGRVFIVGADGRVEWEAAAPSCDDLWVLPGGNVLVNNGRGVVEFDRQGHVAFRYDSTSEVYACQRLPGGNTLVGECNAGRLVEVDHAGHVVKQVRLLAPGSDGGHLYMRNARKLGDGHYLVCHYADRKVCEYDAGGALVRAIASPGAPHSAVRLPGGNTLVACGDTPPEAAGVYEIDRDGKVVWQVKGNDLPGITLRFVAGVHRLPNGNTVMSHWLGHGHLDEGPQVIEVTPDRRVVWTFNDHRRIKSVSSVVILDAGDGDAGRTPLH